ALLDNDGRFLVERVQISVAPSASVLALARRANPRTWTSMLLLGDPDGRLPGSRAEVRSIAAGRNHRLALVGAQATKERLARELHSADVVHLATHGRFVQRAPWRSHLEMAGEDLSVAD